MQNELLQISEEIQHALHHRQPIIAMESPLISNNQLTYDALETTIMIEKIIRNQGVVPAPIALHQGKIHVGLNHTIMEDLANQTVIARASRRDLPYFLCQKLTASTTIATAIFCAHLAKLPIFVTGGIGGVHQHVHDNFDIATDIIELSSTPITLICSGAKSTLDLPKTLELLETQGVSIIGYQTDEFPAFFSHSSGIPLLHRMDTPKELAQLINHQRMLHINKGLIIANPIPKSAEIPDEQITPVIKQAQNELQHINGKSITPFLLQRIAELTADQGLKANIELIKNNALLGAQIAIAYQEHMEQFL